MKDLVVSVAQAHSSELLAVRRIFLVDLADYAAVKLLVEVVCCAVRIQYEDGATLVTVAMVLSRCSFRRLDLAVPLPRR